MRLRTCAADRDDQPPLGRAGPSHKASVKRNKIAEKAKAAEILSAASWPIRFTYSTWTLSQARQAIDSVDPLILFFVPAENLGGVGNAVGLGRCVAGFIKGLAFELVLELLVVELADRDALG